MDYLFPPGSDIRGFKVIKPIAQGGVSEIYDVKDRYDIRHTLKIPLPRALINRDEKGSVVYSLTKVLDPDTRTKNEIEMLNELRHPNIIQLHGVVENIPIPGTSQKVTGILLDALDNPMTLEEVMKDMPQEYSNIRRWQAMNFMCAPCKKADPDKRMERLINKYGNYLPNINWHIGYQDPASQGYKFAIELADKQLTATDAMSEIRAMQIIGTIDPFFDELNRRYADLILQVETGIEHMMTAGIIHKDLKPSNILVDQFRTIKIIDFGMASHYDDKKEIWASRTTMPPEGYLGITHQTADLWALGVIAYEATYGHHPFSDKNDVREIARNTKRYSEAVIESAEEIRLPLQHQTVEKTDRHRFLPFVLKDITETLNNFEAAKRQMQETFSIVGGAQPNSAPLTFLSDRERDAYRLTSYLNINPHSRLLLRKRPPFNASCSDYERVQVNGLELSSLTIK